MSMQHSAVYTDRSEGETEFERDVRQGLTATRKMLPCKYLYDEVGSALFDTITKLREYGCTRAEMRLLKRHRSAILKDTDEVIELGCGSGEKAAALLFDIDRRIDYHAIDISPAAINCAEWRLQPASTVSFHAHIADYLSGLKTISKRKPLSTIMFLGSSIGNFTRDDSVAFLKSIRSESRAGDRLLLGTDLIKPITSLTQAYDDPAGVTSAFNKNLLARINSELGANFDLSKFAHEARWNEGDKSIEMQLRSLADQTVRISRLGLIVRFADGETILTERCHKYESDEIKSWLKLAGWDLVNQWVDHEALFALNLAVA